MTYIDNTTKKINSLSAVIPAYNEEKLINKSILLLNSVLKTEAKDYEIIVIDDGSTDNTLGLLKELSFNIPELKIIHNESNQGLGGALRKGFQAVSKELVLYTDADMPVDYSQITRIAEILESSGVQMVIGFRQTRASEPAIKNLCSIIYNWFIRRLFNIRTKDINFAFKLIRKKALDRLDLVSNGSFIDAEMVIKAVYLGYDIKQIDVEYFSRKSGGSRLFKISAILYILYEIFKFYPQIAGLKKINEKAACC